MAGSYPSQLNPGMFIPTTNVWDVTEIYNTEVTTPEFKELLVRLYQNLNVMALAVNLKDTGYYTEVEFLNSQAFFPNPTLSSTTSTAPVYRQAFRKLINFGALPNTATKSVAHGIAIDANYTFTRIYGAATNPSTSFIPLPYASPTDANNIELNADGTNINIITGSDRTAYTTCYVICEYIKS